jgi:hypothetical protein
MHILDSYQAGGGTYWVEIDLFKVEHTVDYDIDLLLYIPPIDIL